MRNLPKQEANARRVALRGACPARSRRPLADAMPASAEMLNRTYEVADESSCSGHLSFDDRDLGLNNQLAAFSYMLCTVNLTRVCSLWAPPLGYIPCGTHMPGTRVKRVCQIPSERAAVNIRELLKLPPAIDALLARGELRANASDGNVTGLVNKCKPKEMASGSCQTCGPYGKNPFTCAVDKLAKGSRVFMLYAYGLRYHQRNRHNPDKPACPMLRLQLSDQVELYSRQLMGRLKLEPGKFIAAQYRTGWAWRVHTQKMSAEWACYGQRTINRSIARLGDRYPSLYKLSQTFRDTPGNVQVFLLTNARSLHEPSVPVPVQCSPRSGSSRSRTRCCSIRCRPSRTRCRRCAAAPRGCSLWASMTSCAATHAAAARPTRGSSQRWASMANCARACATI